MNKLTLIKGGKTVDIKNKTLCENDILTDGVNIIKTDAGACESAEIFNAGNRIISPGFIDLHCHLRDPGFEYKEDIYTGTSAAAAGGFTSVVCMPNTKPVIDNVQTLEYVLETATKRGLCHVLPCSAITKGQKGIELCDFETLHAHGAVAFTDDGKPVSDSKVMYEAMKRCSENGYLIITHPEEFSLSEGGVVNEGIISKRLNVKGIPNAAEDLMIARDIVLAEATHCRLHIAHVSTKGGIQLVREAKARGVNVTCETCPHYFSFCDEDILFYGTNAKMNPPLRSSDDVKAVIEGIRDGTVDCISTDHAPHAPFEKDVDLKNALNGIIGLQTAFSACVTYLLNPGHIDIFRLLELMAYRPAEIIGIPCGIVEGGKSNFTILSLGNNIIITKNMLKSKSFNTPFMGMSLRGTVEKTFVSQY